MATTETVDVVMPQMGVSVSEGTITKWLKQEGEQVEADEPLLEISTDKVDTEVPSPGSGTLTQILVQEGADGRRRHEARRDRRRGRLGRLRRTTSPSLRLHRPPPSPQPSPMRRQTPTAETVEEATPAPSAASETTEPSSTNGKTFVSPVVAKIASEHGVDPSQVEGTGPRRPRDEEGHPQLHRVRRQAAPPAATPAQTQAPSAPPPAPTAPPPAAKEAPAPAAARAPSQPGESFEPMTRDAQGDRRAHAPLARHVRARHERDRGRHVERSVRSGRS